MANQPRRPHLLPGFNSRQSSLLPCFHRCCSFLNRGGLSSVGCVSPLKVPSPGKNPVFFLLNIDLWWSFFMVHAYASSRTSDRLTKKDCDSPENSKHLIKVGWGTVLCTMPWRATDHWWCMQERETVSHPSNDCNIRVLLLLWGPSFSATWKETPPLAKGLAVIFPPVGTWTFMVKYNIWLKR